MDPILKIPGGILGATVIDPATLFSGGEAGDHWDPFTLANLFQLSAGTTPVASPGDPVGYVAGQINGHHLIQATAGMRPVFQTGYLSFASGSTHNLAVASSSAAFKFLHDGTGGTLLVAGRFGAIADPNTLYGIASSCAASAANHGFVLWYDDRASAGRTDALVFQVNNGTSTILASITNDALIAETDVCLALTLEDASPDMNATVGGDSVATANATGAFSSSNSTNNFAIGGLGGGGSSTLTGRIYGVLAIDRILTPTEIAGWAAWIDARMP